MQSEQIGLGQYQIRRLLGEGGFGQVFEAWDARLQRSIAIKRLKPQQGIRTQNLVAEARLAASLRHPAFVKIFSIDGDDEQQSIIMEYVDGLTLRNTLDGKPLPEAQALGIAGQVAEAMREAHASQLIHGDLKPANLMLEASGAVRIMDFGLARKLDPQATESVAVGLDTQGTIAYLAPELLLGKTPNIQSDVYALGVVLYELLTGARPFAHLSGLALAAAQIQSSSDLWPFAPHIDARVAALVRAMTARDPAQRLASMADVLDAIDALARPAPAPALSPVVPAAVIPPAAPSRPAPPSSLKRYRNWALGAGVLALAFGAGQVAQTSGVLDGLTPFSETRAMKTGLAGLRHFDRDGSIDAAVAQFDAVLERKPQHAGAAAGLAMAYCLRYAMNSRDATWLKRADASAQLAIKLDDQLALGYAAQSMVRSWQRRTDDALALAEKALALDPLNLFALTTKAEVLIRQRKFAEAGALLDKAVAAHPRERILADTQGSLLYQQGQLGAAEQAFRRSIEIEPDSVTAYANLSAVLQRMERNDESLQVLQQGLQVRPNSRLYTNLGTGLFNRSDYIGAAKAFEQAISAAKGDANDYLHWANLADTLRWIPGRQKDSMDAYRQAADMLRPLLASAPNDATLISRMGLYAARTGDKAEAARLSARAVEAMGDSADVRFRAAMVYELSGAREQALTELLAARARGYPASLIESEPDLIALRRDPRFLQPVTESVK